MRSPRTITAPLGSCLAALLVVTTTACAQGTRVTKESAGSVAPTPAPAAALAPLPPNPADSPEAMFADPRIAATASRSNFSEIEPSRLALTQASMPAVRQYAQMMVDEHTALESQMRAMLAAKNVTPVDNGFSLQLYRNLPPTLEMLRARTGLAFDESFMAHMVTSHMTTLHTLDTSLIPEANDPEMKAMLQNVVRPKVAAHLEQAKALHHQVIRQMPATPAGAQPMGDQMGQPGSMPMSSPSTSPSTMPGSSPSTTPGSTPTQPPPAR